MKYPLNFVGVCISYLPKCFQKSGKYRIKLKKYLKYCQDKKVKLVMTLLVKDEEKLIEANIRFHYAMGIDQFIVTVHNSSDKTLEIVTRLKAEGIPIEIVVVKEPEQKQAFRVDNMINIAQKKYKADWIINADADEFYYSKDLNLKRSILKYNIGNVIRVDSTFSFPDGSENRLLNPHFITTYVQDFWYNLYPDLPKLGRFRNKSSCPKVIHKTKGYKHIHPGNHDVAMWNKKVRSTSDIILYHFTDGTYEDYLQKAIRYLDSLPNTDSNFGVHVKYMQKLYHEGNLEEYYNARYSKDVFNELVKFGVVTKDYSLINYLKYKEILR